MATLKMPMATPVDAKQLKQALVAKQLRTHGGFEAAPVAAVRLGGEGAALGVGRLGDPIAASTELGTVLSALVAFANGLAPGTVTPPQLAAALAHLGDISGASVVVVAK